MKKYVFGADVGGTTCKLGLFETDGTLLEKWEIPTNTDNNGEAILQNIAIAFKSKIVEREIALDDVEGIGVGVPGPVTDDGVCQMAVNLGWGKKNISEELSALTGVRVKAGNDANVAALGECWMGAGKEYDSVVVVTLGTGIGGGVIINNKIVAGAHGAGGEIGHMTVNPDEKRACNCGLHGCIEQYASATGFARIAKERLEEIDMPTRLRDIDDVTAKDVFDAAKANDPFAKDIVDDVCGLLADALARIACVVDPEAFLIGGGVSKAGNILIDTIEKHYREKAFTPCKVAKIGLATLGNDAGIYGAARMVID